MIYGRSLLQLLIGDVDLTSELCDIVLSVLLRSFSTHTYILSRMFVLADGLFFKQVYYCCKLVKNLHSYYFPLFTKHFWKDHTL
jgi:hypothetical protein